MKKSEMIRNAINELKLYREYILKLKEISMNQPVKTNFIENEESESLEKGFSLVLRKK